MTGIWFHVAKKDDVLERVKKDEGKNTVYMNTKEKGSPNPGPGTISFDDSKDQLMVPGHATWNLGGNYVMVGEEWVYIGKDVWERYPHLAELSKEWVIKGQKR